MREIKFRGKPFETKDWAYGAFLPDATEPTHKIMVTWGYIKSYNEQTGKMETLEVSRDTVGQYTGLKDKNGREIFEGDIVHCISRFDDAKMVVIFEEGEFRMVLLEKIDSYVSGGGFYALRCFEKEVIGNIHDNPELMEG